MVVATDRYIAEDALDLIEVSYRPRPAVVDPEAALAPDAPVLHEALGYERGARAQFHLRRSGTAFPQAEPCRLSVEVSYPRVNSTPIETYGVIAELRCRQRRYTVWSNFQGPYALHPIMCDALACAATSCA